MPKQWSAHPIHKLHTISEKNTPTGLHATSLQGIALLVLAVFTFKLDRLENVCFLLSDLGIIGWRIVDFHQHLQCLFFAAFLVTVSR